MMIVLIIIAGAVASAPIVGTILVGVASRREESSWRLGGPAKRPLDAAARRVMDFHSAGEWPQPKDHDQAKPRHRRVAASIPVA
jgi:hypothetical protein